MASPIRAHMDIEPLGNIGGLLTPREDFVPNIQSVYGDIIQNAPDYQYFTAPLSNQGRTTATYGGQNNIVVAPDTPIRVVDNATGQVVYSGVGYEGAQGAIDAANALSASTGKKANWDIQVAGPTMQGFQSVSTDRPDVSGLGILADVALPVAGSLLAGPLGLGALGLGAAGTAAAGAAIGSGLSSAAQGRSIEDALLRAAIAGGGSYLGSQIFAPGAAPTGATVGENLPSWGVLAEPYARAAEAALAGSVSSVAPSAVGEIVVNALGNIPGVVGGAFGPLATSVVPSIFDAAQINNVATVDQTTPAEQPSDYVVTAQVPAATTPAPTIPGILPPTTPTNVPAPNPAEDIVATAQTQTQPVTPTPVILPPTTTTNVPPPNPAEDIVATAQTQTRPVTPTPVVLPPATTTPNVPAPDPTEDIRVTAPRDTQVVTPPAIPPVFLPPTTTPPATTPTDTTPPAKNDDFLGTGLSLTQLAALMGLSVSALQSLLGGSGGGTTPTTPYVSPFGAIGGGFGAGVDYRVNPNIIDYERYGFGPEASFFRPEYSGLVSRAAGFTPSTTQTASGGGTANPVYQPLIGPNNPAAYQQGGPNPDAMRLMNFNPMSGLTGNGILDRLQQQFNQAGSTYVSKTDGTVPTQLTQEELWGIMS